MDPYTFVIIGLKKRKKKIEERGRGKKNNKGKLDELFVKLNNEIKINFHFFLFSLPLSPFYSSSLLSFLPTKTWAFLLGFLLFNLLIIEISVGGHF